MGELVEFVNLGGNVLLCGSEQNSEAIKDFAYEFSVDFSSTLVTDYFHNVNSSQIIKSKIIGPEFVVNTKKPILYRGVGHALSGKNNLVFPILVGQDSSFSGEKKVSEASLLGSKLHLVSAFQALNNARVVFAGSNLLFSNEFFNKKVVIDGKSY
jgi:oligosaccharyltransferase complex subunit beta